jgi:hypothetical protein
MAEWQQQQMRQLLAQNIGEPRPERGPFTPDEHELLFPKKQRPRIRLGRVSRATLKRS